VPEDVKLATYDALTEDVSDAVPAASQTAPQAGAAPAPRVETQQDLSAEIRAIGEAYAAKLAGGAQPETQPRLDYAPYRSSILRHPTKSLHHADPETIELYSPAFGHQDVHALEADLTIQHNGEPQGERIIVAGRVLDGDGRPVAGQLVEIWQANSSGRYIHKRDQHPAPLDDLFGTEFTQRIVTQMYFPGDQLFPLDPIYQSIVDQDARDRLVATYDHDLTEPEWALGYNWDIVLSGSKRTWTENEALGAEGDDE
jgi:protocatechuate 3,4-dioxygenase beta subunit